VLRPPSERLQDEKIERALQKLDAIPVAVFHVLSARA
jgi:hypothetical protein